MNSTFVASFVVLAAAGAAGAQTSELFLFSTSNGGGSQRTWVYQGGQLVRTFDRQSTVESTAAVAGTIRSFGHSPGQSGYEYDLNGNLLGGPFTNNSGLATFYDGGTDGVNYNFSVRRGDGHVVRFDRNWQNPVQLFNTGLTDATGLTYDTANNSVWVSGLNQDFIREYDLNGTLLSSFTRQTGVWYTAIAYDPADNTLWMPIYDSGSSQNQLRQFDKSGNVLQTITVNSPYGLGVLGAEFNIPAPGAAALLGLGGLLAARRRRA